MTIISTSCDKECHHLHEFPEGLRVLLIDDDIICLTSKKSDRGHRRKCLQDLPGSGSGSDSFTDQDGTLVMVNGERERKNWTQPLHKKFVDVIGRFGGVDKAVPKNILEMMGVPNISSEQVASHLQKHRKAIQKQELETHNNMIISNNNNHHHYHLPQLPANNTYPVRGPMVGSTIGHPTPHNNISNYLQPGRELSNWVVHNGGC
ncbi:hypothetical protein Cgig2_020214 [Carnegiea gigantea]|uniref:Myb-like domain-containing protein n=1 Tax=Carnegiea gigantea TaxID=171969 RepID=A0A9Q1KW06_9CARY|nr:hypothetical protein Cgig2_020214 [Carnegiea gigantea]